MTIARRLLVAPLQVVRHPSGRSYAANAVGLVDIPYPDYESLSGGQFLIYVGTTADRPTATSGSVPFGAHFYDTTLSKVIAPVANSFPLSWVDVATGIAA